MDRMLLNGNVMTVAVAVAMAIAASAAQGQGTSTQSSDATGPVLEEIVVTARKREESLQDVPLTVTAITSEDIVERGIRDPRDLSLFTPGFSYTSAFGRNNLERPVIRGQSNIIGDPNASFFIDGVYLTGPVVQTEVANLERIEVIKGPQAALYGRATFAGAVNYVTKRPSQEFEGKITVDYGNYDFTDANAWISGPVIADKLYYYIAARYYEYGGSYTNTRVGRKYGDESTAGGTLKFLWTPNENTDVTWLTTYAQDDDGHPVLAFQGREFNNCQLRSIALPRSPGYYCGEAVDIDRLLFAAATDLYPAGTPGVQRDKVRTALQVKSRLDGYELAASLAYSAEEQATGLDVSYGGFDLFGGTGTVGTFSTLRLNNGSPFPNTPQGLWVRQYLGNGSGWRLEAEDRNDFQGEIRISSPTDRQFRWLFGGYYLKASNDNTRNNKIFPDRVVVPNGQGTLAERDLDNRAIFGSIEYDFTDNWTVTAEVRRAQDRKKEISYQLPALAGYGARYASPATAIVNLLTDVNTNPAVLPTVGAYSAFVLEDTWKSTTPRVTLRYKPSPEATFYANWAKGNKPGGFNSGPVLNLLAALGRGPKYEEEEVKSYEVGAKFSLFDRRANLTLAAYSNELVNQQLTQNIVGGNPPVANSFIDNVGETKIKGLEVGFEVLVTENWNVQFGYSFVDAKIVEFLLSDQAALYSPTPSRVLTAFSNTNSFGCLPAAPGTTVPIPAGRGTCADLIAADIATYGDVSGKVPPRAPRHSGFVTTRYEIPLANDWKFSVGGDVNYEGSKFDQVHNLIETGDRVYVNARFGVTTDSWSVYVWGRNLNDDNTPTDILRYVDARTPLPTFTAAELAAGVSPFVVGASNPRGFAITPPRPRTYGINFSYKF